MAVTQSQYNFVRFTANGDALNFKGCLAGLIITKTSRTSVGAVRISDFAKGYHIVPLTYFLSAATPITQIIFPGDRGMMIAGLHVSVCSNMNIIAIKK